MLRPFQTSRIWGSFKQLPPSRERVTSPQPLAGGRRGREGAFLHTVHGWHTVRSLPATPGLCLLGKDGTALRTPQTRGQLAAEPRVSSFTDKVHGFPGRPPRLCLCPPRVQALRPAPQGAGRCRDTARGGLKVEPRQMGLVPFEGDPQGTLHRCHRTSQWSPRDVWDPEEGPLPNLRPPGSRTVSSVWQVPYSFTEEARPWRRERVFKSSVSPWNWSFQRPLLPQQRRVESREPTQKASPQRHKAGTLWSWRPRPHEKPTRYVCPFSNPLPGDIPQWAVMAVPGLPKHVLFLSPGQGLVACGPGSPKDLDPEPPEQRTSHMQHRGAPQPSHQKPSHKHRTLPGAALLREPPQCWFLPSSWLTDPS